MPNQPQSRAACAFCGKEYAKAGMIKHLVACPARQEAITQADAAKRKVQPIFHLRVQDAYALDFWMDLEMKGDASLDHLDQYLRAIWLECCGHLSQFGDWGEELSMRRKAGQVFSPGMELLHLYDFGTTSETRIKVVGQRVGQPLTKHPIFLMARNQPPAAACKECGEPATHLCLQCLYEEEEGGSALCDEHTATHPHDDYGEPMPLVNSPRLGMCGYDGPAEPPY